MSPFRGGSAVKEMNEEIKAKGGLSLHILSFWFILSLPLLFFIQQSLGTSHLFWRYESLHTAFEVIVSSAALLIAFVLWERRPEQRRLGNQRFALGAFAMGVFGFFYAITPVGNNAMLLQSMASLLGSFFFVLIWIPQFDFVAKKRNLFMWLTIFTVIGLNLWILYFPKKLPLMFLAGHFTIIALWINGISGVLFVLASLYCFFTFKVKKNREIYVFACLSMLLGTAQITFPFSLVWGDSWWFWHVLRLGAFSLVLGSLIQDYQKMVETMEIHLALRVKYDHELRLRAEALRESEEKFRGFAENSPEVFILNQLKDSGKVFYANPAFEDVWGYQAGELVSAPQLWLECVHPEDQGRVAKAFEDFACGDAVYDLEYRILRKDGSLKWIHDVGFRIVLPQGKGIQVGRIARDITLQKKFHTKLKEEEQRIRAIIQTNMDGFLILDLTGQIKDVNTAYSHMSGYSREELLRLTISDLEAKENLEETGRHIRKLMEQGHERFETQHKTKDGRVYDAEISMSFLPLEGGLLDVFVRDITERKNIERRNRELMDAKALFVSMVTHELRTPLTAIKEGIGIVLDGIFGDINEKQKGFLEVGKRNVDRLHRLIDEVLEFQKMNTGKMAFFMQEHDLNVVAREVCDTMRIMAEQRGLKFEAELDGKLPFLRFDRDKIIQVLTNLVHNAIKFTEQGNIWVRISQHGNMAQVSVRDTGPGIEPADMPKLFQSFQQFDNVKREKTGNSGLGLAICKEIISRHQGRIWVESESGKGSTFNFVLPIDERRNR